MTDPREQLPEPDEQTDDAVRRPWAEPEHWEQEPETYFHRSIDDYAAWRGEQ